MCLVVTGIGTLIHVYSVGYMADDKGFARYFAYLNLFLFFMLLLVLGNNLLVMFVGWEGVGLASYLLIGFWFEDPEKTAAGVKAFIVNRVGDTGFVLAAFLIYIHAGSLDFPVDQRVLLDAGALARRDDDHRPPAAARRVRQVGADPPACLAAGRDGRADAGIRADPCGNDGHCRRVPPRAPQRPLRARARSDDGRRLDRRRDGPPRRDHGRHAIQPEEGARLLDDLADRLHGHGLRRRRVLRRDVPPHDPRVLQGLPLPGRRRRPARAAGRGRHAQHGRPRTQAALHVRHVPRGNARALRNPAVRRLLLEGRDPLAGLVGAGRLALVVARRPRGLRAHRFLHVPRDLPHVLRHESCRGTASGRRARAAAFDVDRPRRPRRRLARCRVHRDARLPARVPRRLGAVLQLSRAAVPAGGCRRITLRAPRSR